MFSSLDTTMASAAKLKEEAYLTNHIEELKEKMRTLQNDRKTNIDVLEANKQANKEDIKRLREENKEFRQKLAHLQRTVVHDIEKDEVNILERQIDNLRRELDETKLRTNRLRKVLEIEQDKVSRYELDSHKPHMEDNEYTRRIRLLENKLDKAMIKFNEAQSIKKTYEQIVKRLQEERIGYDNQLTVMERTLNAKKRDYEELVVLSGDSAHAKDLAANELDRIRRGYEEERKRREKELRERYHVIQLRKNMLAKLKERENLRIQLEEEYGRTTLEANALVAKQIITEKLEQKNKIEIFENAFRKIKEATGVSDVNEVINKILSQESTTENLISLTHENQRKLEALLEEKKAMKVKVEEMKYNGLTGGIRRKLVDDSEDALSASIGKLERTRVKYDRYNKMLISLKAGIGHLQDKLEQLKSDNVYQILYNEYMNEQMVNDISANDVENSPDILKTTAKNNQIASKDLNMVATLESQNLSLQVLMDSIMKGQQWKSEYDSNLIITDNIQNTITFGNDRDGMVSSDHVTIMPSFVSSEPSFISNSSNIAMNTTYEGNSGMMTPNYLKSNPISLMNMNNSSSHGNLSSNLDKNVINGHINRPSKESPTRKSSIYSISSSNQNVSDQYAKNIIVEEVNGIIGLHNDMDDEEVTRNQLKKQASEIVLAADRKKKKSMYKGSLQHNASGTNNNTGNERESHNNVNTK